MMKRLAGFLGTAALLLSALHFIRVPRRSAAVLGSAKVLSGALAPCLTVVGLAAAALGLRSRSVLALLSGLIGALASAVQVRRTAMAGADLAAVFGPDWPARIPPQQASRMLSTRWSWRLPAPPSLRVTRDLPFLTVPAPQSTPGPTEGLRPVYCDIWQPPAGTAASGVGVVYLHGGAWYLGDKDMGTRAFFSHLAGQGHVIMDVAYRMAPETGIPGMVGDAKSAIAWLKAHAGEYGVNPARVVLAGGSAGAHLALLTAYTPGHPELTPAELAGTDVTVAGVVAFYGPTDAWALLAHHNDQSTSAHPAAGAGYVPGEAEPLAPPGPGADRRARLRFQRAQWRRMGSLLRDLMGGGPDENPAFYELVSPVTHAGAGSPPTLLLHGDTDVLVPVAQARELHRRLLAAGARVAYLELPGAEHAFDLVLPRLSPPAQAAWYEVERFLALVGLGAAA